jgi:hypothetical protein
MNDFWFTWANTSKDFQTWSFLDCGNYFELAPQSKRVEENQYDIGDRINILVSNKLRATLVLTGTGWILETPTDHFILTFDPLKKTVQLDCTLHSRMKTDSRRTEVGLSFTPSA